MAKEGDAMEAAMREWLRDLDTSMDEAIEVVCKNPAKLPRLMRRAMMYLLGSLAVQTPKAKNRPVIKRHTYSAEVEFWSARGKKSIVYVSKKKLAKSRKINNAGLSKESWWWDIGKGEKKAVKSRLRRQVDKNEYREMFTHKSGLITVENRLPWIDEIVLPRAIKTAEENAARRFIFVQLQGLANKEINDGLKKGTRNADRKFTMNA